VQLLDIGFVEAELGRGGRDLREGEHADLLPAGDQPLDLFKLLQVRRRHLVVRVHLARLKPTHDGASRARTEQVDRDVRGRPAWR